VLKASQVDFPLFSVDLEVIGKNSFVSVCNIVTDIERHSSPSWVGEEIKIFPKDKSFQAEHSGWWFIVLFFFQKQQIQIFKSNKKNSSSL